MVKIYDTVRPRPRKVLQSTTSDIWTERSIQDQAGAPGGSLPVPPLPPPPPGPPWMMTVGGQNPVVSPPWVLQNRIEKSDFVYPEG